MDHLNTMCALVSIGSLVALGVVAAGFNLTEGDARYVVLVLSVIAALTSVLLTVRDYSSRATAHRIACRQYGALCRTIESIALITDANEITLRMNELRSRWDWVSDVSPNASRKIREWAKGKNRGAHFLDLDSGAANSVTSMGK
jgi:hypothetical protein